MHRTLSNNGSSLRRLVKLGYGQPLSIVLLVGFCVIDALASAAAGQQTPASDELMRFPFVDGDFFCATVKMFDEKVNLVVDTGATSTVLDEQFRQRLGSRLAESETAQTMSGKVSVSCYRAPQMTMISGESQVELELPRVWVANFSSVQSMSDRRIAGVLGMDVLKDYVLRLNFDEEYAALVSAPRETPAEVTRIDFGNGAPLTIRPSIRMLISNDQFHNLRIDTGGITSDITLEPKLFRKLCTSGKISVEGQAVGADLTGFSASTSGELDKVELGNFVLTNVDVGVGAQNQFGLKFLQRFETELDFPNRKAYFRPGKRLHQPTLKNLSNFAVRIVDKTLVVAGCRGIASDAGIRDDDILVKINNHPAREMTISEFRHLQCVPDSELLLVFERDGKRFDVALKLKRPQVKISEPSSKGSDEPNNE